MTSTADDAARPGPLADRTIVVTRSRSQASSLSARLRALGADTIEIPTIAFEPPASFEPLDAALRVLESFDWLIVTSANTARVLGDRLALHGIPVGGQPKIVAVGPATASALRQIGLRVDLVPEPAVAESVVAALRDHVRGQRVLLARAAVARDLIPVALAEAGAEVTVVDAYRTVLPNESLALISTALGAASQASQKTIDAFTFTSSSTVTHLLALMEIAGIPWPAGVKVFSIGPITSETLRAHGIVPDKEAARHDVDGLTDAVVEGLGRIQPG